jgi:dUTP pyrophosphatase
MADEFNNEWVADLNIRDRPSEHLEMPLGDVAIISNTPADPNNAWRSFLLCKKLDRNAIAVTEPRQGDVGYDLSAFEGVVIPGWGDVLIGTKLAFGFPVGYYGRIAARSGGSVKFRLEVGAGVIDNSYRGEVKVHLYNLSDNPYTINAGDRIAQMILTPYMVTKVKTTFNAEDLVGPTLRGTQGFGSTGI